MDRDAFVFPAWFRFQKVQRIKPPRPADRALAGEGVLDCDHCEDVILGSILDLRKHYRENHPLALTTVSEDGKSLRERLKDAEKSAMAERIQNDAVPDAEGPNA